MKTILGLAASLAAALPAVVQAQAIHYVATPVAAPTQTAFVTRSAAWRARGAAFVATQAPERPAILCELVVAQAGALSAFTVAGKPFDADALARCNAHARTPGVTVARR